MDPRLVLTIGSTAAGLFALCRLIYTKTYRTLPWFTVYLAAGFLQSFIWLAGNPSTHAYLVLWGATMPAIVGLRIVVVVELWRKLTTSYSSIQAASRSFVGLIVLLAIAVSIASGLDTLHFMGVQPKRLAFYSLSIALRYSGTALCVICSCLSLFAVAYPGRIPRRVLAHSFLLTAYFASIAGGYLAMNYIRGSAVLVGAILSGSSAGLYVLWGLLLPESGAREPARVAVTPVPAT